MSEEMVDVVNDNDEIIGSAPRRGIHNTGKLHRSAHIFLLNSQGKIWLEKRAPNTDTFPGYYNSSAAGHIRKGERYLEGAEREAYEELGISNIKLEERHKLAASKETSNEFVAFFIIKSDAEPRVHEATVSLRPYSIREIDQMIANGEKFVPIFLKLFEWYKANLKR